jgi:hypothetical protein
MIAKKVICAGVEISVGLSGCGSITFIAAWLLTLLLVGCAGLTVETVGTDKTKDANARGFRYYQGAPFLFVRPDGKGGLTGEIKYLADTTQIVSARPFAYASSNETTLKFSGGMLSQASVVVDETAVVNASLDALSKVLLTTAKAAFDAPTKAAEGTVPLPALFRIVLEGDTIVLRGGEPLGKDGKPLIIRATLVK